MHAINRKLIIIPAWNEADCIVTTIKSLQTPELSDFDILVINDGSTDNTSALAKSTGVNVIDLPLNMGVGGGLQTGFKYAHYHNYDCAIQFDADGQHNPEYIRPLTDIVLSGNYDIAIGSRFAAPGDYKMRGLRKLASVFTSAVVSKVAKHRITDVTSGFRAGNSKAIAQYFNEFPKYYLGDTVESLIIALRNGLTVTEIPVEMNVRQGGTPSNNSVKAAINLIRALFALALALTVRSKK